MEVESQESAKEPNNQNSGNPAGMTGNDIEMKSATGSMSVAEKAAMFEKQGSEKTGELSQIERFLKDGEEVMSVCLSTAEGEVLKEAEIDRERAKRGLVPLAKTREAKATLLRNCQPLVSRAESLPGIEDGTRRNINLETKLARAKDLQDELTKRQEDEIALGEDAFTANSKRAREPSGDTDIGPETEKQRLRRLYIEEHKTIDLEQKRRIVCFTQTAKDFFTLMREFNCDIFRLRKEPGRSYQDYLFEQPIDWHKGSKTGHVFCDRKSKPEEIMKAMRDTANKDPENPINCQVYLLSKFVTDWSVALILLNGTPMARMKNTKEAHEYLKANLEEFNEILEDDWILAAVLQPRQGPVPVYEPDANGKKRDTGKTRIGRIGNTMAVIHIKNLARESIKDDMIVFQHGKVEVRWTDNDNLYACGYVEPEDENPNLIELGSSRGGSAPARGGYKNRGGRSGQPAKNSAPQAKKPRMTGVPEFGQSNLKEWPLEGSAPSGVQRRKGSQETIVLAAVDFSHLKMTWLEIAKEFTAYNEAFQRKVLPEINHHIKTYQEVRDDCYGGPEMSVAGASTDTTVTVQGVKTLKNQKKKKAALMRKSVTSVLNLRQEHVKQLGRFAASLKCANTMGDPAALQLMTDIETELEKTHDTIRDPQKVVMIPHSLV